MGFCGANTASEVDEFVSLKDEINPKVLILQFLENDLEPKSHYFSEAVPYVKKGIFRFHSILSRSSFVRLCYWKIMIPIWNRICTDKLISFWDDNSQSFKQCVNALRKLYQVRREHNIDTIFLLQDDSYRTMSQKDARWLWRNKIKEIAKNIGYYVVDAYEIYKPLRYNNDGLKLSIRDGHPNKKANEIISQALSKEVGRFIN